MFNFDQMQKMLEGINRSMARQEMYLFAITCLIFVLVLVTWFDCRKKREP